MEFTVEGWRQLLIAVAALNLGLWSLAARRLWLARVSAGHRVGHLVWLWAGRWGGGQVGRGGEPALPALPALPEPPARGLFHSPWAPGSRLRFALLWLSAGYALGCAYRSCWPVFDVPRLVVVDSWMSSVAIGRSVATLAELCLALQAALVLYAAGLAWHSAAARRLAGALVPLVLLAEACSWYSVLTTSNLGHCLEESLWGVGAAAWTAGLLVAWLGSAQPARVRAPGWPLAFCMAVGAGYVLFMFAIDVPMYGARWLADEAAGRTYLTLAEGLADVAGRRTVSTDWVHWRSEVPWMTLYFSAAVWLSIALVHLPLPLRERGAAGAAVGNAARVAV